MDVEFLPITQASIRFKVWGVGLTCLRLLSHSSRATRRACHCVCMGSMQVGILFLTQSLKPHTKKIFSTCGPFMPRRALKPSMGTCEVPVTNCSSRAKSSCTMLCTTVQNHEICGESRVYPVYSVFARRSSICNTTEIPKQMAHYLRSPRARY